MKKYILLFDDEPDIRELLIEDLSDQGYRVSGTGDPDECKRILEEDPPALMIMDLQVEEGDGFTMIHEVKKLAPHIPILLLTGVLFDKEVVHETILKTVAAYLDKTASLKEILVVVKRLLGDPVHPSASLVNDSGGQ
ncbi:MAG: response regulator [Verrucomicrobiota bacterium]|jgi:DNA-binding response OmpR family regulator